MVECKDMKEERKTKEVVHQQQKTPDDVVKEINIDQLESDCRRLHDQLSYSSLSAEYCENLSNNKKSCDCVNQRVTTYINEIFPGNLQAFTKNNKGGGKKQQDTSVAGVRKKTDQIFDALHAERQHLLEEVESYEDSLHALYQQLGINSTSSERLPYFFKQ